MLQELRSILMITVTLEQIVINLLVALVCGIGIALLYRWTYRGPGYTLGFVNAIVYLAMITAVVIMVIGNNLARAFGLVGAMSIIRFRTAVKDTTDIVFIFYALAVGMAAGVGFHKLAFAATVLIGLVILMLSKGGLVTSVGRKFLLQFSFTSEQPDAVPYLPILKTYCRRHKLINVKSDDEGNVYELAFYVDLKDEMKSYELLRELGKIEGISRCNIYFDEESF